MRRLPRSYGTEEARYQTALQSLELPNYTPRSHLLRNSSISPEARETELLVERPVSFRRAVRREFFRALRRATAKDEVLRRRGDEVVQTSGLWCKPTRSNVKVTTSNFKAKGAISQGRIKVEIQFVTLDHDSLNCPQSVVVSCHLPMRGCQTKDVLRTHGRKSLNECGRQRRNMRALRREVVMARAFERRAVDGRC